MLGLTCFVCGMDSRTVKLANVEIDNGKAVELITVCDHCRTLVINGNNPATRVIGQEIDQQGYIKPSVRPS